MTKTYYTKGTCSKEIDIETENGIIKSVKFKGGCNGNLQGVARTGGRPASGDGSGEAQGYKMRLQADLMPGSACPRS